MSFYALFMGIYRIKISKLHRLNSPMQVCIFHPRIKFSQSSCIKLESLS